MTYTITTNPSLDYTVEAELIPGQINRTSSEIIYPGGKGINVSLALQRLDQETRALGFAAGRIGQTIRDLLDDLGCPHTLLELSGGGQSRINVKIRGSIETAVNGHGPALGAADLVRLLELLQDVKRDDAVVISGWVQNISFYVSILEQLSEVGCMTVLDCSGEALWQCLACHPFLIKPNLSELGALFGVEDLEFNEAVELAHQLQLEGARTPSKYRTQSTICSRTFGPAIEPSLLTWPMTKTVMFRPFASCIRAIVQSLTCVMLPGGLSNAPLYMVWMESIINIR